MSSSRRDSAAALPLSDVRSHATRLARCTAWFLACLATIGTVTAVDAQTIDPIVLDATDVTVEAGAFSRASSTTGAAGYKMTSVDAGWDSLAGPSGQPVHYFEAAFDASAGIAYHLWFRLRAAADSKWNESVWIQFDDAVDPHGTPLWAIGSTSALLVNLEDCSGCGVSGWGWQDNAWWQGQQPLVRFARTGRQRIRVQLREDGVDIDQIVLSATTYVAVSPGALRNDATVVPKGSAVPLLAREPYLQQVTPSSAIIVFATSQPGNAAVRLTDSAGVVRSVPAPTTIIDDGLAGGSPYYQHVAHVTNLSAHATYAYDPLLDGADLTRGVDHVTTAPPIGTGQVRFIAFGDSGVGSAAQRQLAGRMSADTFDFGLHTGDLAYGAAAGGGGGSMPALQARFFDIYRDWLRRRPLYPSIGNHDDEAEHARPYLSAFVLPEWSATSAYPDHAERYYSFDYGPLHVVVLDTELAFREPSRRQAQLTWLTSDLAATRQVWKVAVFHRSPYSAGGEHGSDVEVQAAFGPVFASSGVSLVLTGHEHDYERTLPQRTFDLGDTTYVVTGGGGAPLYPAAIGPWTAYSASRFHYIRGFADTCQLALEAVGLDGTVFDTVSMDRCGAGPRPFQHSPAPVPGRVQAERFDEGGEGVAHHDRSAQNEGGQLRNTSVDLEVTTDVGGGHNLGWVFPGEWLTYTIAVSAGGAFDVRARVASPGLGGTFTLSIDGTAVPGAFQIPATGGWQRWRTIQGPRVVLAAGIHRIRLDMRTVSAPGAAVGNVNYLSFEPVP